MAKHRGRLELTWTDKDKALLSTGDGKYDYTFVDPADYRVSEVRLLHEVDRVSAETPDDRPEGLPVPTENNLLITGDAMHALDALAKIPEYAEEYLGKVKLVYIDPPFNTGQAFVNYEDNIAHSVWLTMLRDRLRQIRPLLSDDGSVWVHLDDVEVHRCRAVMDEELGVENFMASIAWRSADTGNYDDSRFSNDHNTILVYGRYPNWAANGLARNAQQSSHYKNPDNDPRGPWFDGNPLGSPNPRENLMYTITSPTGHVIQPPPHGWRWGKDTLEEKMSTGDIRFSDDGRRIVYRTYLWEQKDLPPSNLWGDSNETGSNRKAKNELKSLFGLRSKEVFDTPKPESLLQRILMVATNPGDIVLDCFAGSGTTAAVAHKMGRRWVTSELITETVEKFALPRLTKVVQGQDPGGVTTVKERVAVGDLPIGMSPRQAQTFSSLLNQVLSDPGTTEQSTLSLDLSKELARLARKAKKDGSSPLSDIETATLLTLLRKIGKDERTVFDVTPAVKSQLNQRVRTRNEVTTLWHGGGSFRHLIVGPSMFTEVAGMTLLADWATQGALAEAMCAQLEVSYEPDGIFAGRRGRTRYVVVDGMVGTGTVASILDQLEAREIVEVWATQIAEDAPGELRKGRPGSRLELIPDAVLDNYRRKAARKSPFGGRKTTDIVEVQS